MYPIYVQVKQKNKEGSLSFSVKDVDFLEFYNYLFDAAKAYESAKERYSKEITITRVIE